jgi:type I restriction enzyme S subunit
MTFRNISQFISLDYFDYLKKENLERKLYECERLFEHFDNEKWIITKLGNLVTYINGYPYTSSETNNNKIGFPVIKSKNIGSKLVIIDDKTDYIEEPSNKMLKSKIINDDLLMVMSSQSSNVEPLGVTALYMFKNYALLNQRVLSMRAIDNRLTKYLYYYINQIDFHQLLSNRSVGSAQANLKLEHVFKMKIRIPNNIENAQKIGSILFLFDKKIEINNKINKNLEELAQTLYKRWFVDFEFPNEDGEPYKSSGGEMVESELGLIPKGWRVIEFGEIFDFVKGKKPSQLSLVNEKGYLPYLTIANIESSEKNYADAKGTILVSQYDTVMVMDGGSSGKVFYGLSGILGSTMSVLSSKNPKTNMFILLSAKYIEQDIREKTTGSAIPHTDKELVKKVKFSINDDIVVYFGDLVKPIFDKIIKNRKEIHHLTQIRDELLPKLMNGEIEVPIEE